MQNTLRDGIKAVKANQDSFEYFCASHGDLTPWNSFIVQDKFFAFDLEYFKCSYTPFHDLFHFLHKRCFITSMQMQKRYI